MNDFHATPLNWSDFLAQFESTELGQQLQDAKDDGDFETAMSLAGDFLNPWLWEHNDSGGGFPVTVSSKGLGLLASRYPTLRTNLDMDTKEALDNLLLPFAGKWMEPQIPRQPASDLPENMKLLAFGALSVALSPERCFRIANALQATQWQQELDAILSNDEEDETIRQMLSVLTQLIVSAKARNAGVISVFET
ncbi:hypothetical protein JIN84_00320 [Luteolibacter yonseiensis]|uniref:Uncharacterized protein n=1 Tax=Luteolibacter yonseiensis TaxID=1144680 RepID=A0A934R0G1_9BACT|nr:hypothetical protein [Luteolibacter yonseiensis]MBK1814051.1 hypothetical protein [Luteolibacter yonseiensis]